MSTIEKLFVQIFDRKRQIIERLNHQKQLYDQHLASKLLIQGITPPPWLLNSDKFASSSAYSSDPIDLNKEELVSGLLFPCPQPLPTYSNVTHLYGNSLSTVANSEQQHDLVNATSAGCKGLDDYRPGGLPQCLFRGLEDHHVAESPQERAASDIYADPVESLARMQRSKSRQKALEIRSNRKVSVKSPLEGKTPGGPRIEDMVREESATAAGGILSSSKDDSLLKKQFVSRKEDGDSRCHMNEADASVNWLSPHSVCQDLSVEESLVAADSVSGKDKLYADSLGMQKTEVGESALGSTAALGLSNLIARQVLNRLPVELILQDEVVSAQRMQLASVFFSEKKELQGDKYSGETKCDAHSFEVHRVQEGEVPSEIATIHGLSNEIAGQVVNLCAHDEDSCQLQVERPTSVSSDGMKLVIGSSGKKKVQKRERYSVDRELGTNSSDLNQTHLEQSPAEVASAQGLSAVEVVKMSPEEHRHQLLAESASVPSEMMTLATSCPGENSRESHGRCGASTDECNAEVRFSPCRGTAECSGAIASELASSNSDDKMKFATVKQKLKLDDIQSQAVELQANCFSKEVKFSVPPKLLELQTLWTECSPTSSAGGSWPRKKRRKIESFTSKSASPNLQVNPKIIFSHEVYVGKSCTSDFSARNITQNDISSLSILSEHSSTMQYNEEKPSSQGRSNVEPERLQVSSVSSFNQQFIATPPGCIHKADQTREKSNFSFSISKVDVDPADSKIWYEKNSLEVNNTLDCSGGSPFVEHKEAVGAEGDVPDLETFTFEKKGENSQNIRDTDVNMADKVDDDNMADILKFSPKARCLQKSPQEVKYLDCLGVSPIEHRNLVGRSASVADLESFTFKRKCNDTQDVGDLDGLIAIDLPKNTIDRAKFLERLCRSASLGVPLSHFQASYSSDRKMDICRSAPIGVLEHTDLRSTSALDDIDGQLLESSHTCTKHVENSELQGNSFDDFSPTPGTQLAWDFRGPYISPFSKAIEGVSAKSRGSSKRGSSNPELTCFPIEESGEEDEIADDNDYYCPEETSSIRMSLCSASEEDMNVVALDPASKMASSGSVSTEYSNSASDKQRSSDPEFICSPVEESSEKPVNVVAPQTCKEKSGSARHALRDISKNVPALVLHPSPKRSTESFSRPSSTSEANKKIRQSSRAQPHKSEILKKRITSQNVSLSTSGVKKPYESRDLRFSKPIVSAQSDLGTRGGSFSEKERKLNNIVSNISSFVPLVHKNQADSRAPVKKEVRRVKALEDAEAARQLEQKKENERKQKKEARELEKARREQENLRQLELQKKENEEKRKRKDAEIADRKRRREEEERKEKERKRKRVGEARKQQKGHEDKMPVDKEECRTHAEDGKTDGRKEANAGREETVVGGQKVKKVAKMPANNPATSSVLPIASGDLNINELGMSSDPCEKQKDVSVVAGCSTPTPDVNYSSTTQTIREKSYDISPYCCSDEEEEEELRNDKFIPAWASKSSVTKALASLITLDPEVIFPPSSFCSLNEVLLPRQLKQR